jgi:hypothetical protein
MDTETNKKKDINMRKIFLIIVGLLSISVSYKNTNELLFTIACFLLVIMARLENNANDECECHKKENHGH